MGLKRKKMRVAWYTEDAPSPEATQEIDVHPGCCCLGCISCLAVVAALAGVLVVMVTRVMPVLMPKMMSTMMPKMMAMMEQADVQPPCAKIILDHLEAQRE